MEPSNNALRKAEFVCHHLGDFECDFDALKTFKPTNPNGSGLTIYLQKLALAHEYNGLIRTYLVYDAQSNELVGYFSLKAGLVSVNERTTDSGVLFDTLPGVELANFAVNGNYRDNHPSTKGCGRIIFANLIMPTVRKAAETIGISTLYIFSLSDPKVIANYERYGFRRLSSDREELLHRRLKPAYDTSCVFMYMLL